MNESITTPEDWNECDKDGVDVFLKVLEGKMLPLNVEIFLYDGDIYNAHYCYSYTMGQFQTCATLITRILAIDGIFYEIKHSDIKEMRYHCEDIDAYSEYVNSICCSNPSLDDITPEDDEEDDEEGSYEVSPNPDSCMFG